MNSKAGQFGYFLGYMPVMIGARIGYVDCGTENRWEPFSYRIPDVTVREG